MAAIVIPAHDEAAVIGGTLRFVLAQVEDGDEVIVVCNGCSDETALVARGFGDRVTVLETEMPSKTNALNLGDREARSFPRIYLDADVRLEPEALARLKEALRPGRLLAVSPTPVMDVAQASWAVRAYYDIWLALPYCRSGMIGAGTYALSEEGRARFAEFPSIIADDGYVRALFKEHERGRVEGATAIVRAPATLGWLLKIKTRSRLGGMELARKFPNLQANEAKDYGGALRGVLYRPLDWPKAVVYLYVNLVSRSLARRRFKDLSQHVWEKDQSARVPGH